MKSSFLSGSRRIERDVRCFSHAERACEEVAPDGETAAHEFLATSARCEIATAAQAEATALLARECAAFGDSARTGLLEARPFSLATPDRIDAARHRFVVLTRVARVHSTSAAEGSLFSKPFTPQHPAVR